MAQSSKCFLNRCSGLNPPRGVWCHITGTDLVRDGDGTIYVLEDNLRCPSGVSYVLENREVMKRTFPQMLDGLSILPVEDYPEQLLKMLQYIAPPVRHEPTVVVLTPGSYNSAYFEHCFLAQQMGVELVQGSDLLVSDGYVHMRTTHGLKRVDVIYRRIDDDFLDPLTFRPDSCVGVPGLMDVYRAGRVALANAPGTGIADDKAVYAYVPQMIRYYLGEEIKLPNVPTFICADDKQRQHVLANLDQLVIKPTNESGGYGIMLGPRASREEREKYRGLIENNPDHRRRSPRGAARRSPPLHPLRRGDLHPSRRAHAGGAGQGLAGGELVPRGRQQGYLGPQERHPPRSPTATGQIAMLSRVAESIYWMSRYTERAEDVARFIDVNLNLSLDLGPEMAHQWAPLIFTTGDQEKFQEHYGDASPQNVIQFLTFDEQNPNSIISCLRTARENARQVRDMISSAMWEELNKFYLVVRDAQKSDDVSVSPFDFFGRIKLGGSLLEGVAAATMSRGEAWHFRRLGRSIERADKTSRILDVKYYLLLPSTADVGTPLDTVQWAALLKSASALEMYRKKYGRITPVQVAEFLVLDCNFPRAMHYCLIRAEQSLLSISGSAPGTFRNPAEQHLGRLRAELDYANMQEIIQHGLHEFIDAFQVKMNLVGTAIHETFFAHQPLAAEPQATQVQFQS
jgi:uncharacterized alpha-E superfamily protein